jgi:leader peptidase (prepilin peptidase)/N-methyltransferase
MTVTAVLTAVAVGAAPLLAGARPAALALAWFGAAAVVLAGVDLLSHRLPDRVTVPTAAGCAGGGQRDARGWLLDDLMSRIDADSLQLTGRAGSSRR